MTTAAATKIVLKVVVLVVARCEQNRARHDVELDVNESGCRRRQITRRLNEHHVGNIVVACVVSDKCQ